MAQGSPINKEAIRILIQDIGYQEASKQTGIAYATLRQWAKRGGWNHHVPKNWSNGNPSLAVTTAPADAHVAVIQANGNATKLGLSTYARRQAEALANKGKLKDHHAFRNVTAGASQLHGWNDNQSGNAFTLNVLNLGSLGVQVRSSDTEQS